MQKSIDHKRSIVNALPIGIRKKLPKKITIIDISLARSRQLNRRYRKKRTPANVLSFFYSPEYGEIIVCPAIIRTEARAAKRSFEYQMTWMVVHGMLHLAGVHHEQSKLAQAEFEKIEEGVMRKMTNF